MNRAFALNVVDLLILLIIAVVVLYSGEAVPPQPATPLTACYVIYESAQQGAIADVLGGKTAQALRDVGKWRSWDKDAVPESKTKYLELAKALQKNRAEWTPWCGILHGDEITYDGPLPVVESAFADLVVKQGGM